MFGGSSELTVSEDYIRSLVEQANAKMHTNWARIDRFLELITQPSQQISAGLHSVSGAPAQIPAGKQAHAGEAQTDGVSSVQWLQRSGFSAVAVVISRAEGLVFEVCLVSST